jgi:hypothetical protein
MAQADNLAYQATWDGRGRITVTQCRRPRVLHRGHSQAPVFAVSRPRDKSLQRRLRKSLGSSSWEITRNPEATRDSQACPALAVSVSLARGDSDHSS